MSILDYKILDAPPRSFIDEMRRKYPTERETDELLVRKLERRVSQTKDYHVPRMSEMAACIQKFSRPTSRHRSRSAILAGFRVALPIAGALRNRLGAGRKAAS
jgi:hypothetical protein